jgi:hypothetical protein
MQTVKNLQGAEKFFLQNTSSGCICRKGEEEQIAYSCPEAEKFYS